MTYKSLDRRLLPYTKKACTKCKRVLATEHFDHNCRGALKSRCKECCKEDNRERKLTSKWYAEHKHQWHTRAIFMVAAIKQRAIRKGIPYSLSWQWLEEQVEKGCAFTGMPFELISGSPWYPSVDRINPLKGYTPENCRVVVSMYNYMRNRWSDMACVKLAVRIVEEKTLEL